MAIHGFELGAQDLQCSTFTICDVIVSLTWYAST